MLIGKKRVYSVSFKDQIESEIKQTVVKLANLRARLEIKQEIIDLEVEDNDSSRFSNSTISSSERVTEMMQERTVSKQRVPKPEPSATKKDKPKKFKCLKFQA